MPIDVFMPKLGLTMETGTVQRWLVEQGQTVEAGAALLEVETDKVVVEVEAPGSGTLGPLLVAEGETVPIGTVLARIYAPGERQTEDAETRRRGEPGERVPTLPERSPAVSLGPGAAQKKVSEAVRDGLAAGNSVVWEAPGAGRQERIFSSPRARKRAREAGLDWRAVAGSGPMGRVIERDVLRAAITPGPNGPQPATVHQPALATPTGDIPGERPTLVQRLDTVRMSASFTAAPHFYLSAEARADALLELLDRLLPAVERRTGVRLTVTDLLVKIAARALAEHPRANAFWDSAEGGRIGLHRQIHLGVAVSTDEGLLAPVLRNADAMGLAQIAAERNRLVDKARNGKLLPGDLQGSSFTLTNLGMYRVDVFQAILNPPQSAILAVGRIVERPVAIEGRACVRPVMIVTLSCDHRVMDGVLGAQFLGRVVELIEEPTQLMA